MSHSSPLRKSAKNVTQSTDNPTTPTSQDALKDILKDEIGGQTWEFPPVTLARMLSAKRRNTPLEPGETDDLSAYACDIDGLSDALKAACAAFKPKKWQHMVTERDHYRHICDYLNQYVKVCHDALDDTHFKVKKEERWYSELKFVIYDKATGDGVDNAAPLKPDLAGGRLAGFNNGVLYWSNSKSSLQILLPVEVKSEAWTAIVSQAATYARCLFSANPSRQFALVIGINHKNKQLRFLVFHRGGLSASKALSMEGGKQLEDILRLFLSIMTWKSAEDAGFAAWFRQAEIALPRDENDEEGIVAKVEEILSHGICVRGRGTMVSRVSYDATNSSLPSVDPPLEPPEDASPLIPVSSVRHSPRLQQREELGKRAQSAPVQPDGKKGKGLLNKMTPQPIAIFRDNTRNVKFIRKHQEMTFKVPLESPPAGQRANAVIKISCPTDDTCGVEAAVLKKCGGLFGLPVLHYSFKACFASGRPMSNRLFLPSGSADLRDFHWSLFATPDSPPSPEYRSLWVHVSSLVGKSLSRVAHPKDLFYSIAHAMLGWLSILQHGFLHRDISIGNVLTIDNAITMPKFTVEATSDLADVLKAMSLEESSDVNQESSDVEQESSDVEQESSVVKQEITRLLDDLNITEQCRGFTIDLDMATSLKTLFSKVHDGERSGARQFMSDPLMDSLKFSELYLQSPGDDLCSFYYVGQWAALFNQGAKNQNRMSPRFLDLRNGVDGSASDRNEATKKIGKISKGSLRKYPPFLVRCAPTLRKWFASVDGLAQDWIEATAPGQDLVGGEAHRFYMPLFFKFAYRGVKEYLEILKEDREDLAKPLL